MVQSKLFPQSGPKVCVLVNMLVWGQRFLSNDEEQSVLPTTVQGCPVPTSGVFYLIAITHVFSTMHSLMHDVFA